MSVSFPKKSDESPPVTSVQNLENNAKQGEASLCTERVIRTRNQQIPPTLVGIQAISLLLCASALAISVTFILFFIYIYIRHIYWTYIFRRQILFDKILTPRGTAYFL